MKVWLYEIKSLSTIFLSNVHKAKINFKQMLSVDK